MPIRQTSLFTTIRTEGGLLPADFLQKLAEGNREIPGLQSTDYHLLPEERLNEIINRSWTRLLGAWESFRAFQEKLPESDYGTTITRERWLLPLFQELGYGRLQVAKAYEIAGKSYPISHIWKSCPIHLVGFRIDLDTRTAGATGAARTSPHSLMQEFLNRSDDHLWAFVSNGLSLRIIRDNVSLTRQAYVEFDLEAMMDGEIYSDFALLWLLCHQSRIEADKPEECWLERWCNHVQETGTRALETLRGGVEKAISKLGTGFLSYPSNGELREKLFSGSLDKQDYYRQLLRLVYRLLFLFVAEDRNLLLSPKVDKKVSERYQSFYSTTRLRRLAEVRKGSKHPDLWRMLIFIFSVLGGKQHCAELGLSPLGSFLWSSEATGDLTGCDITNADLLDAIRELAFTMDGRIRRPVDYKNLGSEELGSIYESLLELHPDLNTDARTFELTTAAGHERKTTGSYYTPTSLITCLLDSALDPVLDEANKAKEPEKVILDLKVCDPACGSGHFLVAAAHRIAKRLASVRTGDNEPSPEAVRQALRDVIGRCIYGVDLNPMSVELCKVSLWMESLEPGKPLSFLDHHILCGNSLLGATPALLDSGIPDDALSPIVGDDADYCRRYKRANRQERSRQMSLFTPDFVPWDHLDNIASGMASFEEIDDSSITGIVEKQTKYEELIRSSGYEYGRLFADAWCAAFVWVKREREEVPYPITEEIFRKIEYNPLSTPQWMNHEIQRLADEYKFFHWHLAFPGVFRLPEKGEQPDNEQASWCGGFDVVLGNPPWERIKLQEKEWFSEKRPDIANARNAAQRIKMIAALRVEDPPLHSAFQDDLRRADGESHIIRDSSLYPLCGRGDINLYTIFAERMRSIINPTGRMGAILPSGLATDDTTKYFFSDLIEHQVLVSFLEFENEGFFSGAGQGHMVRFALTTISGPGSKKHETIFMFQGKDISEIAHPERIFTLTVDEITLVNPNTRTCPIFQSKADAELTKKIYRNVPVLINESKGDAGNPWGISFMRMLDMATDSGLFRTYEQLTGSGAVQEDVNWRMSDGTLYMPLYEAKMIYIYNHRHGDFADAPSGERPHRLPAMSVARLADPKYSPMPFYWVPKEEVDNKLNERNWDKEWLLGWRDVTDARASERTVIASVIPRNGTGDTLLLMFPKVDDTRYVACLLADQCSIVHDYIARQKIGGLHLKYHLKKQIVNIPPTRYTEADLSFIVPRVLELSYTAESMRSWAEDIGFKGEPYIWDQDRRIFLQAELHAYYALLYGLTRDELRYLLDPADVYGEDFPSETFRGLKSNELRQYGEYRTRHLVLEAWDRLTS